MDVQKHDGRAYILFIKLLLRTVCSSTVLVLRKILILTKLLPKLEGRKIRNTEERRQSKEHIDAFKQLDTNDGESEGDSNDSHECFVDAMASVQSTDDIYCEVLVEPDMCDMDIIVVHGLYGSLANTWKQGTWTSKYKSKPEIKLLRGQYSFDNTKETTNELNNFQFTTCICDKRNNIDKRCYNPVSNEFKIDMQLEDTDISNENTNNVCVNRLQTFHTDMYTITESNSGVFSENISANINTDISKTEGYATNKTIRNNVNETAGAVIKDEMYKEYNENTQKCDDKIIIKSALSSDNTEVKQNDSLKGNVQNYFADQRNTDYTINNNEIDARNSLTDAANITNTISDNQHSLRESESRCIKAGCGCLCKRCYSDCWPRDWLSVDYPNARIISVSYSKDPYLWRPVWVREKKRARMKERAEVMMCQLLNLNVGRKPIVWIGHSKGGLFIKHLFSRGYECNLHNKKPTQDIMYCKSASSVWSATRGIMFLSVPHRGSNLADIKIPPIIFQSTDLLDISRDSTPVLSLHERWLRAVDASEVRPHVHSLVEESRTLMAVLWLIIVGADSADANIGALNGISVIDHREICKPTSRDCLIYKELLKLINAAKEL